MMGCCYEVWLIFSMVAWWLSDTATLHTQVLGSILISLCLDCGRKPSTNQIHSDLGIGVPKLCVCVL